MVFHFPKKSVERPQRTPARDLRSRTGHQRWIGFDRLEGRTVLAAPTTINVAASLTKLTYGQTETLTATVVAAGSTPTGGTVTFSDNGTVIGSGTLANGTAMLANFKPTLGPHNYTAQYGGTTIYNTSASTVEASPTTITSIGTGLFRPAGVTVDASGKVFIAEGRANRVTEVTTNGVQVNIGSGLQLPVGVGVDAFGNIFIADSNNHRVVKVAPDGTQTTIGSGLSRPTSAQVDASGNVFIADLDANLVYKVTPAGTQTTVGSGLNQPTSAQVDASGNVFIADAGNNRVLKVAPDGTQTTIGSGLRSPVDVGLAASGNVFILDYDDGRLIQIKADGSQVDILSGLDLPQGLAVDHYGNAYIADTEGSRVLKLTAGVPVIVTPGAPTANPQTVSVGRTGSIVITLTGTDPDVPALPLTFAIVAGQEPPHGSITGFDPSTGQLTYTAGATFNGSDSFAFTVSNGTNTSAPAVVSITGQVTSFGVVFLDRNADGVQQVGEAGLAGRFVYLDTNGSGVFDSGEPSTTTAADGSFSFPGITANTIAIREATDRDATLRNVVSQTRTLADGSTTIGVTPVSPLAPVPVVPNPFTGPTSSNRDANYVRSLYRAVLGRDGSDDEVLAWLGKIHKGLTYRQVSLQLLNSKEHRVNQVAQFYRTFLHRAPNPRAHVWVEMLQRGVSEARVAAGILGLPEYKSLHSDPQSFVASLYHDVLGHDVDSASLDRATTALTTHPIRRVRDRVIASVVKSPEAIDQVLDGLYAAYFRRSRNAASPSLATLLRQGKSASQVAASLLSSPEYQRTISTATATDPLDRDSTRAGLIRPGRSSLG